MKTKQITLEQQAQIYCIKNGHANYVWKFFGYVHCGRCGQQIGDQLGSIFDTTELIVVNHKCSICSKLKKKLSSLDKKILSKLEKNGDSCYDYNEILKGITLLQDGNA